MPTDYEKLYQEERHVLGNPTAEFVEFFQQYDKEKADVLDVGCGQGRDALFIARMGHHVVGVDLSPSGIQQLLDDAQSEALNIEGIVADLRQYKPDGEFDVVVIDRTLHMIHEEAIRLEILARACEVVRIGGYVLVADEKLNLPAMRDFFENDAAQWEVIKNKKGYLFVALKAR